MTDTRTPEAVAAILKDVTWVRNNIEALAAELAAHKARADAALRERDAAEAKVAKLVEALGKAANRLDWASGLIATETGRDQAGVWAEETRTIIAEVQG